MPLAVLKLTIRAAEPTDAATIADFNNRLAKKAEARTLARSNPDVIGVRLYVEKDNERAQSIYENLGMKTTHYQIMQTLFESEE